ncbi:helix-turn-helix domain-containing protein [Paenibacillus chartarius]|uniref:Helix-turn-helix domain-containing protein n=1 Tax=Paenibacillus chartarius TaxID=747481 RepID=A0ABV6DPP5_9BACL
MTMQSLPDSLHFGSLNEPLWIEFDRRIGHYSMKSNHYHLAYELFYLLSGERNYFIKDSVYRVYPGDLMLVESNVVHKTSELSRPNHERVVVHYSPSFFDGFAPEDKRLLQLPFTGGHPHVRLNLQERMHIEALFGSMLHELYERPHGYLLHIRNMAVELLLFTARLMMKRNDQPCDELSPIQEKVTAIVRHINTHFGEPLHLDELAKQFFISKSHLSRVFKEVTGFGFSEFVNIARIREAERLLRETDLGITQISETCGFENFSHFGKMFKKLSGVSPRAYRQAMKPSGRN